MAFLVSPGVQVKEIDLTNVVPAVATSIGAIAGAFQKGPVSSIVNVTSEEELHKYLVNHKAQVIRMKLSLLKQTFYNIQTH